MGKKETGREKEMLHIAVVEDEEDQAELLEGYLQRFAREKGERFRVSRFRNAVTFLENYAACYDAVLMDIRMPYMSGMDAAHRLRELDGEVLLLFVTSLAQYAVQGYEVNALSYILKPVSYADFALKFTKAYARLTAGRENFLILRTGNGSARVREEDIAYLEVSGRHTVAHTVLGDFEQNLPLRAMEQKIGGESFCRANSGFLVNLLYVTEVTADACAVEYAGRREVLQLSRSRKKEFSERWESFSAGGPGEGRHAD